MRPPIPPSSPSSSAFAPAVSLTLERSRLAWAWWLALHALLAATALLGGWTVLMKAAAVAAVIGHAALRRPRPTPASIAIYADATCSVPAWDLGRTPLGPRTVVCRFWIKLDLGMGPPRRDLLVVVDQVDAASWARLRALLERVRCDAAHVSQGPQEPF